MEKMSTFLDKTIHIMPGCVMHLHDHQNKMVPFMEPYIFADLSNGVKFRNCTCWSTNDTHSHYLLCWVNNHHTGNKDLILMNHAKINL
jgi:hypothetical protein